MTDLNVAEFLKKTQFFNGLNEACIALVSSRVKIKKAPKNTPIIIGGDSSTTMYVIREGSVSVIARNEKGKEIILSTLYPGDVVGELSLIDDDPRSADVVAIDDCELYALGKADFFELIDQNPQFSRQILRYLCQRIRFTNTIAESLALMDVYERLKVFLYSIATETEDGKLVIDKPLTHREIAAHVGSGREVISRILGELVEGEYLTIERKLITMNKKLPKGR